MTLEGTSSSDIGGVQAAALHEVLAEAPDEHP